MAKRLTLLFVALVVGLLAWFLGRQERVAPRDADRTAGRPEAPAPGPRAALEPVARGVPAEPRREAIASVESAPAMEDPSERPEPVEESPGATLVVLAIDKTKRAPLPDVRLWVFPQGPGSYSTEHVEGAKGTLRTSPLTADDGRAEFDLPAGVSFRLSAQGEADGVGRTNVMIDPLEPGERRQLTLEVPTGDDLHFLVRVLAREDETPIAGASVEVVRGQERFMQRDDEEWTESTVTTLAKGVTDSNGLSDVWLASWKKPDLAIRAPGFGEVLLQVGVDHDTPETATELFLPRAASLRARILDAGGAALADGGVRLWTESYHLGQSDHGEVYLPSIAESEWKQDASPSGLCLLEGLPPDVPFHVEVLRAGKAVKKDLPTLSLHAGDVRELEWRLGAGCRLEGSVVDQDGAAVRGQKIWLERADRDAPKVFQAFHSGEVVEEAATDPDGRFVFADVSPGLWWIGPAAERMDWDAADPDALAPIAEVVEVPEGVYRREVLLHAHRGLYIRGQVLDPAGAPLAETYVMASTEAGAWGLSARSGSDGAFALGPLVPGRYLLAAHGLTNADSEPIEASAGDEGVILRLRAGGSLKGTIRDGATGTRLPGWVTVASCPSPDLGWHMSEADDDGTFRFEGLPPGTYCLTARASGGRVGLLRDLSVQAGGELAGLVVTLVPGAELRLKYAGKDGYLHYRIASDGVTVAGDGIPAGGTSESVVPAGRLVVEYLLSSEPASTETKEIDLAVGEVKELVLEGDG